ncbi:MAG: WYL domain-containing protein, partial [Thermodesulfovibrionales bacterium]
MSAKTIYERFLWFDHKARAKRYPNTTVLSKEFEISPKTAQRDIEFMRDRLRCPLLYDQSRKGYYYRDETFSLPMIYLSSEELSSLLIAKKMLQGIGGDFIKQELSSAIDKITGILKKHSLAEDELENTLSFQMVEYSPAPEGIFKAALDCCIKRKCLSFTYYSPASDERIERTVDPYHLLNYMGTWYLI